MSDDLMRARAIAAIRKEYRSIIRDIVAEWKALDHGLPNHRVGQLINSLAWHADRSEPGQRLREFARELVRLWHKAGKQGPEARFYLWLAARLGLRQELDELRNERRDQIEQLRIERDSIRDDRQQRVRNRQLRRQIVLLEEERQLYESAIGQVQQLHDQPLWGRTALATLQRDGYDNLIPLARLLIALSAMGIIDTWNRSTDLRTAIGKEALIWQ
jgi:hypothetical protein